MADRSALLPTSEHGGYGAAPTSSRRERAPNNGFKNRVLAAVAGACGVVGVVALRANGGGLLPAVGEASQARGGIVALSELVARHGELRTVLAQQHREAIASMVNMKVRPIANVPRSRARLGASEYEHCVAKGSAPSESYNVTDENLIRADLTFDVSREDFPAVTAYNDSKALLMSVGCEIPPPATFQETPLCTDPETASFCDKSCSMPTPKNCDPDVKNFGSCEPSVRALCDEIVGYHTECATLREHVASKEKQYDSMEVGGLPCRVTPDAPFAKAAYAQVKYEEAYTNWVDSVNDATEVCTIGHALWVHNLGLYQAHYEKIRETMNDLIQLCENFSQTDLDVNEVIVDTESTFYHPSQQQEENTPELVEHTDHTHPTEDVVVVASEDGSGVGIKHEKIDQRSPARRRLVWWQQLCDPTIAAMEQLLHSLEIASPQLMCFAETCQTKKDAEEETFDKLVKAYNKFVIAYGKYSDETEHYNNLVVNKNTALAVTVSAYESFHPVKDEVATLYNRDVKRFESFDGGDRRAMQGCGLSDCQVNAICAKKVKDDFDVFVDADTCAAKSVGKDMCKANTDAKPRVTVDPEEVLAR